MTSTLRGKASLGKANPTKRCRGCTSVFVTAVTPKRCHNVAEMLSQRCRNANAVTRFVTQCAHNSSLASKCNITVENVPRPRGCNANTVHQCSYQRQPFSCYFPARPFFRSSVFPFLVTRLNKVYTPAKRRPFNSYFEEPALKLG